MISDFAEVLDAAQAGADWAMARIFAETQPRLLRWLRAEAGQDADDIAAAAWLDAARSLTSFHGDESAFRAWLFTIARRRLRDHRRRWRRKPTVSMTSEQADKRAGPDPADAVVSDDAARRIVELLPRDQAEVVLLRVVMGLDAETVAAVTRRRVGSVRVLQHRALRKLARKLAEGR